MMTITTSRSTKTRTLAAAAAVATASTLAACGSSDSTTGAEAPAVSASSSSSTSQAPKPAASPSSSSATSQTKDRASRSEQRTDLSGAGTTYVNWNQVETVPSKTVYVYSADLPKGSSQVTQAGRPGTQTVTYRSAKKGEKVVSSTAIDSKVTRAAVRRVVTVGTGGQSYQQAQSTPQVSRSSARASLTSQAAPRRSRAAGGSGNAGMWQSIARCESGNNWSINTGNGFYGGLQFTQQTWAGYGGLAYAPRADLASAGQQMAIADKVLADVGRGAWPVCGR